MREGLAGLADLPRSGRKRVYGNVLRMEVLCIACDPACVEEPVPCRCHELSMKGAQFLEVIDKLSRSKLSLPFNVVTAITMLAAMERGKQTMEVLIPRTIEQVRDEAIRREVVSSISKSTVQRILSQGDLRPHKVRGWMHSPDPQFREKVTEICDLYHNPPQGSVVISVDEKTGMQARERCHPDRAVSAGRALRHEYEYKRHGTQALLAGINVHTGEVLAHCKDHRSASDLLELMEEVAQRYPQRTVHVIWDNLNTHYDGVDKRWTSFNARHGHRFVFHYTPKHASWVNQIELFFSILQRRCLKHGSFRSTFHLHTAVLEFVDQWNRKARPFRWTFSGYPLQIGAEIKKAA